MIFTVQFIYYNLLQDLDEQRKKNILFDHCKRAFRNLSDGRKLF
jgi:hypothetical protein